MFLGTASDNYDRGRATNRTRGLHRLPNPDELRMLSYRSGSEGMGAKVHIREGKNPDQPLRSLNIGSVGRMRFRWLTGRVLKRR